MSYYRHQILYGNRAIRRERVFRDRSNPVDVYSDKELYDRCRFDKNGLIYLDELIGEDLQHPTRRSCALSSLNQIFITLRFLSSGTFYIIDGDIVNVSKATVSRCVTSVTMALKRKVNDFIHFPTTPNEIQKAKEGFSGLHHGFPGIIGAVDCTHVKIQAPYENEFAYVNRKNDHSINVQAICTADRKFTNIVVKWPGSVHDSRIFSESKIGKDLADRRVDGVLLGDGGYANSVYLLTPFRQPVSQPQRKYNFHHKHCRVRIEQAFGVLKRRFAVLHNEIRLNPTKCCNVIAACCVLHNIAIDRTGVNSDILISLDEENNGNDMINNDESNIAGIAFRNHVVNTHFLN